MDCFTMRIIYAGATLVSTTG